MNLQCPECTKETSGTGSYCMHCGAALMVDGSTNWLVLQAPSGIEAKKIPLLKSTFVLGRGSSVDYSFESTRVSRMHAEITKSSGAWHIRDLWSTNGTQVQGERLQGNVLRSLAPGDVIELGTDVKLLFQGTLVPVTVAQQTPVGGKRLASQPAIPGMLKSRELANPGERLGARIIDLVIFLLTLFMVAFTLPATSEEVVYLVGVGIPLLIQVYLLSQHGQTLGKKVLNLKIVPVTKDYFDTAVESSTSQSEKFLKYVVLRLFVGEIVLGIVPFYFLVDSLFIFRADQRCIHDLIAGTQVIKLRS